MPYHREFSILERASKPTQIGKKSTACDTAAGCAQTICRGEPAAVNLATGAAPAHTRAVLRLQALQQQGFWAALKLDQGVN